ncbi:MAG: AMP-binding protein, partial [Acidimicrobiia bacterium]|nr:AMP-binding protein [Acidimicrobiia bacterium]
MELMSDGALAQDRGPTDVALLDETIGANLARTVAEFGDNEALVARHQGVRWTYAEFADRVSALARGLIGLGLERGDRVGLWSPNYAEWTLVQYATAEIGVILVNLNPSYRTHELAYALNQSGAKVLFAAPSFKTSDYIDMVEQVQPDCPSLERAVFFWEDDWDEVVAGAAHVDNDQLAARRRTLGPDDSINIQYTSGTTGYPKGATLSHRNILNNGYFVTELQRFGP